VEVQKTVEEPVIRMILVPTEAEQRGGTHAALLPLPIPPRGLTAGFLLSAGRPSGWTKARLGRRRGPRLHVRFASTVGQDGAQVAACEPLAGERTPPASPEERHARDAGATHYRPRGSLLRRPWSFRCSAVIATALESAMRTHYPATRVSFSTFIISTRQVQPGTGWAANASPMVASRGCQARAQGGVL
jgi:hypothetical protein